MCKMEKFRRRRNLNELRLGKQEEVDLLRFNPLRHRQETPVGEAKAKATHDELLLAATFFSSLKLGGGQFIEDDLLNK